jgi:hypothetical protein
MTNDNNEFDPIYDYIGKIVILKNAERQYAAKLIAVKGNELWLEARNKAVWMQSRKEVLYIGLTKSQVA